MSDENHVSPDDIFERTKSTFNEMQTSERETLDRKPKGRRSVGRVDTRLVEDSAKRAIQPKGRVQGVRKKVDSGGVEVEVKMHDPVEEPLLEQFADVFQGYIQKQGLEPLDTWTEKRKEDHKSGYTVCEEFSILVDFEGRGKNVIREAFGHDPVTEDEDEPDMGADLSNMKDHLGLSQGASFDEVGMSPKDAAERLMDKMGLKAAEDEINVKANMTDNMFLNQMQDALADIETEPNVEERNVREPYSSYGASTQTHMPAKEARPREVEDLKQALGLSREESFDQYGGEPVEAVRDAVRQYGPDKTKKLLSQSLQVGSNDRFIKGMVEAYNDVLDKMGNAKKKLKMGEYESTRRSGRQLGEARTDVNVGGLWGEMLEIAVMKPLSRSADIRRAEITDRKAEIIAHPYTSTEAIIVKVEKDEVMDENPIRDIDVGKVLVFDFMVKLGGVPADIAIDGREVPSRVVRESQSYYSEKAGFDVSSEPNLRRVIKQAFEEMVESKSRSGTNLLEENEESWRRRGRLFNEDDEEDPCEDGYTMVGTKMLDGEEVPNCVPDDEVEDYEPEESRIRNAQSLHEDEQLSDVDVEEGKMSEILGVPEDEDIGEAYDGSPEDAVEELVSAVGEDEAASMINYAANLSGDSFLEDMQDAIAEKDYSESDFLNRADKVLRESHEENTRRPTIKNVGPIEPYVQNLKNSSILGQKLAGVMDQMVPDEEIEENLKEDLEAMSQKCWSVAQDIKDGGRDMRPEQLEEMAQDAFDLCRHATDYFDEHYAEYLNLEKI